MIPSLLVFVLQARGESQPVEKTGYYIMINDMPGKYEVSQEQLGLGLDQDIQLGNNTNMGGRTMR